MFAQGTRAASRTTADVCERSIVREEHLPARLFEELRTLVELRLLVFGALERRLTMKQLELPLSGPKRSKASPPSRSVGAADAHGRRSQHVPHSTRPEVSGPVHGVLRIARGLPDLRSPKLLKMFERSFRAAMERAGFAITHYSIQRDHIHVVVEVADKRALARGMQALAIRIAKQLNARWNRKGQGRVFAERYFALALTSYRQMWRTVRYVLNNGRKHGSWTKKDEPDPFSSGPWFVRWSSAPRRPSRRAPVARSRYYDWLACIGVNDVPGPRWQEALA